MGPKARDNQRVIYHLVGPRTQLQPHYLTLYRLRCNTIYWHKIEIEIFNFAYHDKQVMTTVNSLNFSKKKTQTAPTIKN